MSRHKRQKVTPLRYFFYKGNLCKKIQINRGNDIITAWNYPAGRAEKYQYSDVRRNGGQAFRTKQVAQMVGRTPKTLKRIISEGHIKPPQKTYGLDAARNEFAFYWSEEDIMGLHDYLKTVHIGRPRLDGLINTSNLPSAAELRAMIRQGTVFYVKQGDEFVPTWQAEKF